MINFLFLWFKKPNPVSLCILKTGPGVKLPSLSVHSSKFKFKPCLCLRSFHDLDFGAGVQRLRAPFFVKAFTKALP